MIRLKMSQGTRVNTLWGFDGRPWEYSKRRAGVPHSFKRNTDIAGRIRLLASRPDWQERDGIRAVRFYGESEMRNARRTKTIYVYLIGENDIQRP